MGQYIIRGRVLQFSVQRQSQLREGSPAPAGPQRRRSLLLPSPALLPPLPTSEAGAPKWMMVRTLALSMPIPVHMGRLIRGGCITGKGIAFWL